MLWPVRTAGQPIRGILLYYLIKFTLRLMNMLYDIRGGVACRLLEETAEEGEGGEAEFL